MHFSNSTVLSIVLSTACFHSVFIVCSSWVSESKYVGVVSLSGCTYTLWNCTFVLIHSWEPYVGQTLGFINIF